MSKSLDALKRVKTSFNSNCLWAQESCNIIEKELKALEILKAFDFDIEDYTEELNGSVIVKFKRIILDNDEIDLLKEVLL